MHLPPLSVLDGNYVLIENTDCSEIYDVTTMEMVCRISATGLLLRNGNVINPSAAVPSENAVFSYQKDRGTLQKAADASVSEQLGRSCELTDAEKAKYGIE